MIIEHQLPSNKNIKSEQKTEKERLTKKSRKLSGGKCSGGISASDRMSFVIIFRFCQIYYRTFYMLMQHHYSHNFLPQLYYRSFLKFFFYCTLMLMIFQAQSLFRWKRQKGYNEEKAFLLCLCSVLFFFLILLFTVLRSYNKDVITLAIAI